MDTSLNELYQEIILEHNRMPRNKLKLSNPTKVAQGYNPSCGDDITVFVEIEDGILKRVTFDGEGCAISQASASLMTELLIGKSLEDAEKIIEDVFMALNKTDTEQTAANGLEMYGEVASLIGVKKFPMRIKCATLAWHAVKEAIS
jgi:nitrogen fixation NifU-like protein